MLSGPLAQGYSDSRLNNPKEMREYLPMSFWRVPLRQVLRHSPNKSSELGLETEATTDTKLVSSTQGTSHNVIRELRRGSRGEASVPKGKCAIDEVLTYLSSTIEWIADGMHTSVRIF